MEIHDAGFETMDAPTDHMSDGSDDYSAVGDASSFGDHDAYEADDGTTPSSGEIEINVGGQHSEAQETIDLNNDGVVDSAAVQADNGDYVVFTDTNADGVADHVEVFDPSGQQELASGTIDTQGNVIPDGQADSATGTTAGSGDDPAAANPHAGWVEVRTGDSDLTLQENADLDQNGTPDSVVIQDPSTGDYIAYTDSNADGLADHVEVFDQSGQELGEGEIDVNGNITAPGGELGPYQADGASSDGDSGGNPHPGEIDVDINGQHATGEENIDLNQDGTPDSVAVQGDNGDVVVFTDTNDDGVADRVEVFDQSGHELGAGSIDADGNVTPDNSSSAGSAADTAYLVDPATGEWSAR